MSARRRQYLPGVHGVLLVDKPQGYTSHDVVARIRKIAGFVRCGHAGTLDPMATGVLPVLLGDATRLSQWLIQHDKEYEFTLEFGRTTDTYDAQGRTLQEYPVPSMDDAALIALAARFTGPQMQIPPMYSAIKVGGKKLHKEARKGHEVNRSARPVTIDSLQVLAWHPPFLQLRATCSKGTYIRTLAHDMGQVVGCGACVTQLRRIRVGSFHVQNAVALEEIVSLETITPRLISLPDALVQFQRISLDADHAACIANGRTIAMASASLQEGACVFLLDPQGRALALATYEQNQLRPQCVFASVSLENKRKKDSCNFASFHQKPLSGG